MINQDEKDYCPKTENCPLFNGGVLESYEAYEIYLNLFCTAGEAGRLDCKRFILSAEGYSADSTILPNDPRSIDELKKYLDGKSE